MNNTQLAGLFHSTYERLAPAFGYKTRKASRVPFVELDRRNKALMLAVAQTVLDALHKEESLPTSTNTASLKLPTLAECQAHVQRELWSTDMLATSLGITERVYNFMVRQLQA